MAMVYNLDEFKKRIGVLMTLGDANEAYKNNPDRFMLLWSKASQYYRLIEANAGVLSSDLIEAQRVLLSAKEINPSLGRWLENIIKPGSQPSLAKEEDIFIPSSLTKPIEALLTQVREIEFFTPDHIDGIENELRYYLSELSNHKIYYGENYYQSLVININSALNRVAGFKSHLHNDESLDR